MRVRIRYFAAVREALGVGEEQVDLEAGASVGDLQRALEARHPALHGHRRGLRFAVGTRFTPLEAPLSEGAEVALIPPVSGG
jgi:molybdopterin converting factor subunit 1